MYRVCRIRQCSLSYMIHSKFSTCRTVIHWLACIAKICMQAAAVQVEFFHEKIVRWCGDHLILPIIYIKSVTNEPSNGYMDSQSEFPLQCNPSDKALNRYKNARETQEECVLRPHVSRNRIGTRFWLRGRGSELLPCSGRRWCAHLIENRLPKLVRKEISRVC